MILLTDRQEDVLLSALSGMTLLPEDEAELQLIGARLISRVRHRHVGGALFEAHRLQCPICQGERLGDAS